MTHLLPACIPVSRMSLPASRYCFWRCLCVCASVRTKSQKLIIRNWCNLVGMCPMVNARSGSKLVTFDFDLWPWELFSNFSMQGIYFEWLDLATSFSVWIYTFRISSPRFSFKIVGLRSRSQQRKTGSVQLNKLQLDYYYYYYHYYYYYYYYWPEIAGAEYLSR